MIGLVPTFYCKREDPVTPGCINKSFFENTKAFRIGQGIAKDNQFVIIIVLNILQIAFHKLKLLFRDIFLCNIRIYILYRKRVG